MDGISIVVSSLQISTESTMGASLCFDIETKLVVMCNLPIPLHFWAKQTDQVSWIIIALKNPAIRRQCGSQSSNLHIVVQILALHQFKSINFQPPPPPKSNTVYIFVFRPDMSFMFIWLAQLTIGIPGGVHLQIVIFLLCSHLFQWGKHGGQQCCCVDPEDHGMAMWVTWMN